MRRLPTAYQPARTNPPAQLKDSEQCLIMTSAELDAAREESEALREGLNAELAKSSRRDENATAAKIAGLEQQVEDLQDALDGMADDVVEARRRKEEVRARDAQSQSDSSPACPITVH